MTNAAAAKQEMIDSLLGAPSQSQVAQAAKFLGSFGSSTEALVALVAAMRGLEQAAEAATVEGMLEQLAELEAESM